MTGRKAQFPVAEHILNRWSPRAFTGEAIAPETLMSILEAGRWAPSAYNDQPWRFLYAYRDTPQWQAFVDVLIPFNQGWARNAAALVLIISRTTMTPPGKTEEIPSHSHSFDAGAAWANIAAQAHLLGWATHGMTGLDMEAAHRELGIPANYRVEAMIAIGRQAVGDKVPEAMRAYEKPSDRKPLSEMAFEGAFPE